MPRRAESTCRPGSVTPASVTWHYSPGKPNDLLFHLSSPLISSRRFSCSGGTETELARLAWEPGQASLHTAGSCPTLRQRRQAPSPLSRRSCSWDQGGAYGPSDARNPNRSAHARFNCPGRVHRLRVIQNCRYIDPD